MMRDFVVRFAVLALLAACAGLPTLPAGIPGQTDTPRSTRTPAADLPELTVAELHRDKIAGLRQCTQIAPDEWSCASGGGGAANTMPIPRHAAPFQAQVYLHPDHTTEEYLIGLGIKEKSFWSVRHICGGALIAPGWIATAAHCFPDPELDTKYGVRLGLGNIAREQGHLYRVLEVVRRNPAGRTRDNDIALVRFDPSESSAQSVSQAELGRLAKSAPPIINVAYQPDNRSMLVVDGIDTFHLLDANSLNTRMKAPYTGGLKMFDADRKVMSWTRQEILITDIAGTAPPRRLPHPDVTHARLISGNRDVLSWSERTGLVRLQTIATGEVLIDQNYASRLGKVELLANGQGIFVQTINGAAYLIDRETGQNRPLGNPNDVSALGLIAGKNAVLLHDRQSREGQLVDPLNGSVLATSDMPGQTPLLTEDGKYVLSTWSDSVRVQDAASLEERIRIPIADLGQYVVPRLLEDGRHIQVGAYSGPVQEIWDAETGRRLARIKSDDNAKIMQLRVLPGGQFALVMFEGADPIQGTTGRWSETRTMVWDLASDRPVALLERGTTETFDLVRAEGWQITDGGRGVLKPGGDGRSRLWRMADCTNASSLCRPSRIFDHNLQVRDVRLFEDQNRLIALSVNGTAQLWDLRRGREIVRVFHGGRLNGAKIGKDRRTLITYGGNGLVRFWDIGSGREIRRLDFAEDGPAAPANNAGNTTETVTYLRIAESGDALAPGAYVRVYGWGRYGTTNDLARSPQLREAGLQVISQEACKAPDMWNNATDIHDRVFCATDIERKTCVGDSGGPVVLGNTLAELELVGIASWGSADCEADQKPGVYTRISSHTDWIRQVVGNDLP